MDEDIDIEEHDVLDNPKIRDIFPDLSLVKIEPTDNEGDFQNNVPIESESHSDEMTPTVKREVLSDDENNYTSTYHHSDDHNYVRTSSYDFDESGQSATYENGQTGTEEYAQSAVYESEQTLTYENVQSFTYDNEQSDDYEQNVTDIPNRIILGSKPDYEELYKEAVNSKTIVYLEDWDVRLKTSPCYCHSCEILFPTINCLDAHKSIAHSLLVALDSPRKESPTKNTARKSTVNSTYCNHCDKTFPNQKELITHLYKLLPVENFKIPTPVKVGTNSVQYRCTKCNLHFVSIDDARLHKLSCHSEFKNDNIIIKVQKVMKSNEKPDFEMNRSECFKDDYPLVPKGVMFQCNKCFVCFLSHNSALQHLKRCLNKPDFKKCKICRRKIRTSHYKAHEIQHKYSEKIKVYTLKKSLKYKIIFKCAKCSICYDDKGFLIHHNTCNGERVNFSHCEECGIDVKIPKIASHRLMHEKYTKNDFIIIEFYDLNVVNTDNNKITIYYCDKCDSCKTLNSSKGHTDGSCENLLIKFCNICGLGFGKIHYKLHKTAHQNLKFNSIKDFQIISLSTGEKIDPPIPKFYQCKCHIHFLTRQEMNNHDCIKEKYMICKICNEKYNLKAIRPHSKFHVFKRENFNNDMPDLLKLYNAINNMWDIVYMCLECDLITVTYDSAVEHSQNHIIGEIDTFITCDVCDFNIIEKDFKLHENLHENNSAITGKQFRILKFNYKDMYKKKWMNIFLSLPVKDKHQILSKSIYRCTRRFKLNCEIDYRTDDTKIYCKKCKNIVRIEDMKRHYFDGLCKYVSKYMCNICNLTFKNIQDCVTHENGHENSNKTYKIYSFNDKSDKTVNKKLLNFDCNKNLKIKIEPSVVSVKKFVKKPLNKMALSKFRINKCNKCGKCISVKKNVRKHRCSTMKSVACRICNNVFVIRGLKKHLEMHKQFGKVVTVNYFTPFSDLKKSLKAVIYKCDCGLHFTTRQSIENHLSICNDELEISKETCSKCHRLFPTDVLVTHLCKHHSKPMEFQVIEIPKKSNFKCGFCNVVYLNMNDFDNHLFQCPLKYGKICDKCHLAFDPKNYKQHNCDQSVVVVRKSVVTSTVYKCVQCDLHYLNRRSVRYHLEQDHCCLSKIIACEICNLRFPERSNKRHKEIHDSMKKQYMIKVVDCIGSYTIVKGYNHKNYNRTTLTNDCDDNPTNDTETTLDSSFKIKKEITETPTIAIKQEIDEEDVSVGVTILYRCNSCNICYHFKKTYHYHLEMNHVNKRGVIECPICCLPFTQNSLNNHARVHETGDEYVIHVQEMDQGKVTEFRGINTKVDVKMAVPKKEVKKRPAEYPVSPLTMKTRKSNKRNVLTLDESHEVSPSKIDFESVNMANEDKINTDLSNEYSNDVTDPLVYSSEVVVPDDLDNTDDITNKESGEVSEQVLSSKMKGLLYAKIKNYSHVLYRCVLCNVDFLTAMSIVSHFKRTDHKKPFTALNCDECGFPFSVFTLARHKYIHHVLMKLSTDDMYVLPVPEEYDTKQKIGELLQNTLGDAQEIDDTTEEDMDIDGNATNKSIENTRENIRDANTDEVNMEVDETIVNNSQIHIYQPNSETQNDVTEISNAQENVAERVNLEEKVQKETKIHYYKCADCNVCFIKEELCKTHCVEHKKFDPRLYIECKMCNFQFSLESLMEHVTLHHDTEFCLEDLAVTEYTPGTDGHIKVDTYLGIDKVQSRLVSTTTDLTDVKSITPVNIESSS